MTRYLAALLLLVPMVAWADNSVNWQDPDTGTVKNGLGQGESVVVKFDENETNDSQIIDVRGLQITMQFDPDNTGTATACKVTARACTDNDTNTCQDYQWDTDGDGVVDNAQFDHASAMKKAIANVFMAGFFYAQLDTAPGAGDVCELRITATKVSK